MKNYGLCMKAFVMFWERFPEYPKTRIHDIIVDIDCLKELNRIYNEEDKTAKSNN